jgi:hypothetical protein
MDNVKKERMSRKNGPRTLERVTCVSSLNSLIITWQLLMLAALATSRTSAA